MADKIAVATLLDELGVGFIEGGWPGAMPKDTEFFARARSRGARICAPRSWSRSAPPARPASGRRTTSRSRRCSIPGAQVITLVAKSDVRHVERALRTTLEENLAMVADTVRLLVDNGRRVFLDCEHFFDGYLFDRDYGVRVQEAAVTAGADVVVMCDTNGGMLPMSVERIVGEVRDRTGFRLGIHCQDDTSCAVANTVAAVQAGATHVQCTANGYGERAGNADLFAVVGNLMTKMGLPVLPGAELVLDQLADRAHATVAEVVDVVGPDIEVLAVGVEHDGVPGVDHLVVAVVQPDDVADRGDDVVGGQRLLVEGLVHAELLVDLVAADLGQVVALGVEVVGLGSVCAASRVGGSPGRSLR